MDNARIHLSKKSISKLEEMGLKVISTPPYSPEMSPAEKIIRAIKRRLVKIKAEGG